MIHPTIIEHLSKDKILANIIPLVSLEAIIPQSDIYQALIRSIAYQQLSTKAATTIYNRFLGLYDGVLPPPAQLQTVEVSLLREVGLSNQKATYIKNIATYFAMHQQETTEWINLSDEQLIRQLTTIKGVGEWTVQMMLMFTLGRLDVFPINDLGIRQAMVRLYDLKETGKPLEQRLSQLAVSWQPYRSVAARYLWRWKDSVK